MRAAGHARAVHRLLIEHYAGNFPLWLAPEQLRVMTIGEEEPLVNYAKAIVSELRANFVRCESDFSSNKITARFRKRSRRSPHDAGHRRRDMEAGMFPSVCTARQHRREAEGRSRGGHSGEHQRAAGEGAFGDTPVCGYGNSLHNCAPHDYMGTLTSGSTAAWNQHWTNSRPCCRVRRESYRHGEGHKGKRQDCPKCRTDFPTEIDPGYGPNEYNFEKLPNPPADGTDSL